MRKNIIAIRAILGGFSLLQKKVLIFLFKSLAVSFILICLFGAKGSYADTHTWIGTAASSAWTTTTNWSPTGTPAAGDAVIIGGTATTIITAVPSISLVSMTVNSGGGGSVTLQSSSAVTITLSGTGSGVLVINNNLTLGPYVSISKSSTLSATGSVASGKTFTVGNGTNASTFSWISGGNFTVSGSMICSNASTINFTYAGSQVIPSNITVNSGGTLVLGGSGIKSWNSGISVTINGTLQWAGTATTASSGVAPGFNSGSTLSFAGTSAMTLSSYYISLSESTTNLVLNDAAGLTLDADRTFVNYTATSGKLSIGATTLTLTGTISSMSATNSFTGSASSNLVINGTGAAGTIYFNQTTLGTTNQLNSLTINRTSSGTVTLGNPLVMGTGGTLTMTAGELILPSSAAEVLTINGAVAYTAGTIRGNTSAYMTVGGTGDAGGAIYFSASYQNLSKLTINRSSGGIFRLGSALTLNYSGTNALTLTDGVINCGSNVLTINSGTLPRISGGSASSYVAGPLAIQVPANTSAKSITWPVGKGAYQAFATPVTTTSSASLAIIKVEAFDANCGGTFNGSMSGINTDNYWSASVTANATSITSFDVLSLTDDDPTLTSGNVIGYCATAASGTYTSLGGSVSVPTVTSTMVAPNALGYFVIGTANSDPLCGTYKIGPTGDFATVSDAVASLNARPVTCDVIFELQSTYTGSGETFPINIY